MPQLTNHTFRVIAGIIILVCAACNLANQSPIPSATAPALPTVPAETGTPLEANPPPATDAPQPTAENAQTYTNILYGYSFNYPTDATLEGAAVDEFVWLNRQIFVNVSQFNPEEARGDGPVIESAEDTAVNGLPARRLRGYVGAIGGNTPQRYESIVIPHNGRYYSFTVYELQNDVVLPPERTLGDIPPDALALFEQVVSSVRFTS